MRFISSLLATTFAACALAAHAQDVAAILKASDKFRMSADNLQVETQINIVNADGTPDKERKYKVFAQQNRQSLVIMQSPSEKGQKVLMSGDDFWLVMPDSQRPLRITPMQKLLGDASTGDVSTLSWAEDYTGKLVGEEPCDTRAGARPQTCLHLTLNAARKGVTYQRIELWVGKARYEPHRADLYVLSDKLAKQASFVFDKPDAPTTVTEMVLADKVSNNKTTHIKYVSRKERQIPKEWLNPQFLVRGGTFE
ncbi:MAG: outer membrane lipoprotein-sorting protein [Burkholderiales bacterium]|nr:outer membrane lipoprotein-sorting protein [Burkholderiales bacterium]